MGRPTTERKDRVVKLRISEELYRKIEKGNVSENVRELIKRGLEGYVPQKEGVKKHGEIQKKEDEGSKVPQYREDLMDRAVQREIKSMCKGSGISEHDFYRGVMELWDSGKIYVEYGEVKCKGQWDMEEFEEACHRVNVYPQTMIDKIVKGLR